MNPRRHKYLAKVYDYRFELGFAGMVLLAAFFRFWRLGSVPPGFDGNEASLALKALDIAAHPRLITHAFNQGIGAGIFSVLEAAVIRLFGNTTLAARFVPAFAGFMGVMAIYAWITSWFGKRAGLTAGFLVAVMPWFVTLSRINTPAAFIPLSVGLVMWLSTEVVRRNSWWLVVATSLAVAMLLQARAGWIVLLVLAAVLVKRLFNSSFRAEHLLKIAVGTLLIVIVSVPFGVHLVASHHQALHLTQIRQSVLNDVNVISDTALMFGWHGDNNFKYNLGGLTMFNLFVALMLIVGMLVSGSKSGKARYRIILVIFLATIIGTALINPDAPTAYGSYISAPFGVALAVIGIEYMLETWYGTFPINAAARTLGTLPIILLLAITGYQGYKQYFDAWAQSPEVYQAYNEQANDLGQYLNRTKFDGQRYAMIQGADADIVAYLTYRRATYSLLKPSELASLPAATGKRQFLFLASPSQEVLAVMKTAYPKARLSQHYSEFNEANQVFAVYETE